ncbi:Protein cornichon like protein [Tupaia chinensis]|uniref:Protein cornichon like protein n=1 Tax=Tupaia chinensis TaxID=246437 RepID=L9LDG5_TUPCH|nr:Protein cornichon like protein [Tupaia chinensis]
MAAAPAAFCHVLPLLLTAMFIFLAIWHMTAFEELKTDYGNPIDPCNTLNPLVLPDYLIQAFLCRDFCAQSVLHWVSVCPVGISCLETFESTSDDRTRIL